MFLIPFCLPLLQAQEIFESYSPVRVQPEILGASSRPGPLLRGALMFGPLRPQIQAKTYRDFIRLLSTPAAQRELELSDEQRKKIEDIGFSLPQTAVLQETAMRSLSDVIAILTKEQKEKLREFILRQQRLQPAPAPRPPASAKPPQK